MRSGLKDGKLVPPRSLAAAVSRRRRMAIEIARIENDVLERATTLEQAIRAQAALEKFVDEMAQLDAWIAVEQTALLRLVHRLLRSLVNDATDFTSDELQLINRLDALFAALDEPIKPAKRK